MQAMHAFVHLVHQSPQFIDLVLQFTELGSRLFAMTVCFFFTMTLRFLVVAVGFFEAAL